MKQMTPTKQDQHEQATLTVRSIVSTLRLLRLDDEDAHVALARLENWLSEKDGRWVK